MTKLSDTDYIISDGRNLMKLEEASIRKFARTINISKERFDNLKGNFVLISRPEFAIQRSIGKMPIMVLRLNYIEMAPMQDYAFKSAIENSKGNLTLIESKSSFKEEFLLLDE